MLNIRKKCRLGVTIIISHQLEVVYSRIVLGGHVSFWIGEAPVVIKNVALLWLETRTLLLGYRATRDLDLRSQPHHTLTR